MKTITILNDVVNQLTDSFNKSESVNYLYNECKKIVETKITEMNEYNFGDLLNWLEEIKLRYYKGKYKCIKRIIYSLNEVINNKSISQDVRFVYLNDNSQYKKVSKDSQKIIFDYISKTYQCSSKYSPYLRNYISYYFLYLERNNLDLKSVSYDQIFKFKEYIQSLNLSISSTKKIFNCCADFIYDTSADLKIKISSLILKSSHTNYIEKISKLSSDVINSFDLKTNASIDFDKIPLFFDELNRRKYSFKSQAHSKRIAYDLLFFLFYYNIPLTPANTLLWSKFVYENIVQDSGYRSIGIKFAEFLQNGAFLFSNSYFNSSKSSPHLIERQIENIPLWSKPMVDKYITYRKKLGYKSSTICMDCNSIYRFITYISKLGIESYELIKLEHVLSFASLDVHSTTEGRNAYIARVKGFLIFLRDNNVVDLYIDSRIIGKFRSKKKIIKIISEEDIQKITSHEYTTSFGIRAYAIFLLGIKCGLRSIDIVNLKFENVSFKNRTIKIKQIKTQKEITLPIPIITLNAIYNYVKNVRPNSSSEYIFISFQMPFDRLSRNVCDRSFSLIQKLNGILPDEYKGFHICRKTYASSIINRTKDVDITAYSLGHSDNSTVDDYISIDFSSMHECPLNLKAIGYGGFENESL